MSTEVEDLRRRVKELETIVAMDKAFRDLKFHDVTEEQIRDVIDAPILRSRITDLEAALARTPRPWLKATSRTEMNVSAARLPGVTAYTRDIDGVVQLVFVERRDGKFMLPCPHCSEVYWYHVGQLFGDVLPEDCHRALYRRKAASGKTATSSPGRFPMRRSNRDPFYTKWLLGALVLIVLLLFYRYVSWPLFKMQVQMAQESEAGK